jgi:hypothetical protein
MSRTMMMYALTLAAVGCTGTSEEKSGLQPAALQVSTEFVEFGQLPQGDTVTRSFTLFNAGEVRLGISDLHLASTIDGALGDPDSFSWLLGEPVGGNAPVGDTREGAANTGRGDVRTNDTSDTEDTEDTTTGDTGFDTATETETAVDPTDPMLLTLLPGARAPVTVSFSPTRANDNYDALVIATGDEPDETGKAFPAQSKIYRDADNEWKMVYLHGLGAQTAANLIVSPKTQNFGFVWNGATESRYIALRNVGEGNLTIGSIALSDECSPGFSIAYQPSVGQIIEGGTSSVIEIQYSLAADADIEEARCKLKVISDDADSPEQEVSLVANAGKNANNHAPTVTIISPLPGYQHQGYGTVTMELSVQDEDQPADSLTCRVKSGLQLGANLASCRPTDASGHIWVEVPVTDLVAGSEVLTVTVTDQSEASVKASIPVLINGSYPVDDDDGDGFGASGDFVDCDDTNIATYPKASEIYDGKDNNCDYRVDEETFGFDDDGDGLSELEGDCNDNNKNTYEGAPEIQDSADNDCDKVIDEGTSAYDDDGDGFTELDLDCNDRDVTTNPSVAEICQDGRDNNCNGLKDSQEPCVEVTSAPRIIGGINLNAGTAVETDESVMITAFVFEADGDTLSHKWAVTGNIGTIDDPTGPSMSWTAPSTVKTGGDKFRISYIVNDDDGNQTWQFAEVSVYAKGRLRTTIAMPK